jgi:ATP adenylyltransferase
MEIIFAPWRYKYVSTGSENECVFCRIIGQDDDEANLVLARTAKHILLLNRYPYTTGHMMIAPLRHLEDLSQAEPDELRELMELTSHACASLREQYAPDGINIGMNVGRAAGAGVEHHYHMHVLPRWTGDTSFVSITGDARIIPEDLKETLRRLKRSLGARLKC